MKLVEIIAVVVVSLVCTICYLIVSVYVVTEDNPRTEDGVILLNSDELSQSQNWENVLPEITLAMVICGNDNDRISQAITMLKSAILMSRRSKLRVVAFVDDNARPLFTKKIQYLLLQGEAFSSRITVEMKPTWFPKDNISEWRKLYSLCSTERLFFPKLLPTMDALIYLDTDILVLDDLTLLWNQFAAMNESQFLGMTAEDELPGNGWYNTKATFPYYGPRGLNAGVLLMNLTRMRAVNFENRAISILKEYREKLHWGDQDILNIYLHFNPEYLYQLPCQWNYRMTHCDCEFGGGDCKCKAAEEKGASLFHGNKGVFLNSKYPFANNFYQAYNQFDLLHGSTKDLIEDLTETLQPSSIGGVKCKRLKSILMRRIREQFEENELEPFLDFSSGT